MNSMLWSPLHDGHAIERVRVAFVFNEPVAKKIIEGSGREFDLRRTDLRFAERQSVDVFDINLAVPSSLSQQNKRQGWQAHRQSQPGTISEAVTFEPMQLSYESADYRGWTKAKSRIEKVIGFPIHSSVNIFGVSAFSFECTDRFLFSGKPEHADVSSLLSSELGAVLTKEARSGNELWHIHRGWFETSNDGRLLININVESQMGHKHTGEEAKSIQLHTKVEIKPSPEDDIANLWRVWLDNLHSKANAVFSSCLTDVSRKSIGFGG